MNYSLILKVSGLLIIMFFIFEELLILKKRRTNVDPVIVTADDRERYKWRHTLCFFRFIRYAGTMLFILMMVNSSQGQ
ncbi:hypothetical protein DRE43_25710 [Salmonella enterica subsp. enterica serovar Java]|nr:hypothetical protein [Salmonella enterica]EBX2067983.1 hypothetical protein [Salmonella enterica subsp. enterica serovar Java]